MGFHIGRNGNRNISLNANQLTTHAIVLGTTGSGKTVLCKNIIEQAVMQNLPVLVFDPKGDIGTLAIANTSFDFRPFSNKEKKGDVHASRLKGTYEEKARQWNITNTDIEKYKNNLHITIYTPRHNAGRQVSLASDFKPPSNFTTIYASDPGIITGTLDPAVRSMLALLGYTELGMEKPTALLTQLILHEWQNANSVNIERLIRLVQEPPMDSIGILSPEDFLTSAERKQLISRLNLALSSPAIQAWFHGKPLDFSEIMTPGNVSIMDLRWLRTEKEKQFFVEKVMQEMFTWLIQQPGTSRLKYLVYFDELAGYLPPSPSNPPSKAMLSLLVRQGRAFGLGCLFATQNPGDIDYRIMSNMATRFIGSLRAEQDIEKIASALDLAPSELKEKINKLKPGEFLKHDSLGLNPMQVKWLMSYHRGPLADEEIRMINEGVPSQAGKLPAIKPKKTKHEKTGTVAKMDIKESFGESRPSKKDDNEKKKLQRLISQLKKHSTKTKLRVIWKNLSTHERKAGINNETIQQHINRVAREGTKKPKPEVLVPFLRIIIQPKQRLKVVPLEYREEFLYDLTRQYRLIDNPFKQEKSYLTVPENFVLETPKRSISSCFKEAMNETKNSQKGKYYVSPLVKSYSKDQRVLLSTVRKQANLKRNTERRRTSSRFSLEEKKQKIRINGAEQLSKQNSTKAKKLKTERDALLKKKLSSDKKAKLMQQTQSRTKAITDAERKARKYSVLASREHSRLKKMKFEHQKKIRRFDDTTEAQIKKNIRVYSYRPTNKDLVITTELILAPRPKKGRKPYSEYKEKKRTERYQEALKKGLKGFFT
ncbi:MAG: ATP-binding protein [Candidatus Woesearchaeota archaeon]